MLPKASATIWDKGSADIKKESDSELIFNEKKLKTKINSYVDEVKNFYDKKIPNVVSDHAYLPVISLDSALNKDGNYYPQVFLKECKYIERKITRWINHNFSDFSSSGYSGDSDEK